MWIRKWKTIGEKGEEILLLWKYTHFLQRGNAINRGRGVKVLYPLISFSRGKKH